MAEVYCFEPRAAFKRIDRGKNFLISAWDLVDFLRDNSLFVTTVDARVLIAAYDADKDGGLDFKEFEKLVLSASAHNLKMKVYGRPEKFIGIRDRLHFDIEF